MNSDNRQASGPAALNDTQTDPRIPVYLLTGYLGSGKTSLLKSWLTSPLLKDSALVINELGEVGLDHHLLSSASESSAALVANACVCCTGLPGLAQSLEDLFWARLERRIARFPSLIIETTGLAKPGPVSQVLLDNDLLKERYRLAGVITCLSASTADHVLGQHEEARAQLAGADVLVITKTDTVSAQALALLQARIQHQMAHSSSHRRHPLTLATSAHANFSAHEMLSTLRATRSASIHHGSVHEQPHVHTHEQHLHGHHHHAEAHFLAMPKQCSDDELRKLIARLQTRLGNQLLRLKGRVDTDQGPRVIQLAPFEPLASITEDECPVDERQPKGLTLIVALPLDAAQQSLLQQLQHT
jgi:G3E family GTPase